MKPIVMILFVSLLTMASQLLLKKGLTLLGERGFPSEQGVPFLLQAARSPYVVLAFVLQATSYVIWIFVISKLKLGHAFAISGAFFYILLAAAGWFFLNEKLTIIQWVGIGFITIGILCMNLRFN